MGRQAANTKLSTNVAVRRVRVRGGNYKFRALRLDHGNFSWGTEVRERRADGGSSSSSGRRQQQQRATNRADGAGGRGLAHSHNTATLLLEQPSWRHARSGCTISSSCCCCAHATATRQAVATHSQQLPRMSLLEHNSSSAAAAVLQAGWRDC
jgi:hypothetical protein